MLILLALIDNGRLSGVKGRVQETNLSFKSEAFYWTCELLVRAGFWVCVVQWISWMAVGVCVERELLSLSPGKQRKCDSHVTVLVHVTVISRQLAVTWVDTTAHNFMATLPDFTRQSRFICCAAELNKCALLTSLDASQGGSVLQQSL